MCAVLAQLLAMTRCVCAKNIRRALQVGVALTMLVASERSRTRSVLARRIANASK